MGAHRQGVHGFGDRMPRALHGQGLPDCFKMCGPVCLFSDPGSTERTAQKRKFPSPPHSSNGHSPQDTSTSPIKKKKKPGLLNNNNKEQVKGHWGCCPHQRNKGCSDDKRCSAPGFVDKPEFIYLAGCLTPAVICIGQKGQLKTGPCRNFSWVFRSGLGTGQ